MLAENYVERKMATERLTFVPRSPTFATLATGILAVSAVVFGALLTGAMDSRSESGVDASIEGINVSAPRPVTEELNDVADNAGEITVALPYLLFEGDEQGHIHFEAGPAW